VSGGHEAVFGIAHPSFLQNRDHTSSALHYHYNLSRRRLFGALLLSTCGSHRDFPQALPGCNVRWFTTVAHMMCSITPVRAPEKRSWAYASDHHKRPNGDSRTAYSKNGRLCEEVAGVVGIVGGRGRHCLQSARSDQVRRQK